MKQQTNKITNKKDSIDIYNADFFQQLVDSLDDYAIFTTDVKGSINSWNSGAERVLGYKAQEIIGKNASVLFTLEQIKNKEPEKELQDSLKNGRAVAEKWHVHKSGKTLWGSGLVFPLKDEHGNVTGFTKVMRNLTERRKIQEAISQNDNRYKAFITQSSEGIWRFELDKLISIKDSISKQIKQVFKYGYLAECNDAMAKMYGYKTASEIVGGRMTDFLIPTDPNNISYLTEFIKSGYNLTNGESTELDKEGNVHIFQNNLIGIVEDGYVKRAWGTQRDITKQKISQDRAHLLQLISNKLVSSFNQNVTLKEIGKLVVPEYADYCRIAIIDNENNIKEMAVNHTDPSKAKLAEDLYANYKDIQDLTYGYQRILSTGKPEILPKVDEEILENVKHDKKMLKIIRSIGLKSYMGAPLIARGKVLGSISLSSVKDYRYYSSDDLEFLEEIAHRIALAFDNMRLYQEAQEEIKVRKQTEERLELAQAIGKIGSNEWDMFTNKIYWSPQHEILYGLKPRTFGGTYADWEKLVHPEDRVTLQTQYLQQLKKSDTIKSEFRIIWPDRSVHWIYSKSKVFYDKKGKPVKMVGMNIDITRQKQTEQNLKFLAEASKILATSLDYQTTLNNIAHLAVPEIADWCSIDIVNSDGTLDQLVVAHKDPKKIKLAKEIRKEYPTDMTAASGVPRVLKTGKSELYKDITEEMITATAKDAKHLKLIRSIGFTSAMIIPLCVQNKAVGAITFVTSETRRNFEESDLIMAEELANRASLAIDNARLYKGSQQAITIRDDFISVASHELRTPITSVKIFTQVLQQHSQQIGDRKAETYLEKMDKQLNKLTELIYNLLNISKIQAGRMEFTQQIFDFDSAAKDIIEVLQQGSTRHKIIIKGNTDQKVFGDEDRIGQVISNLISNAIKYSPKADKIIVHLKTKGDKIQVGIQDFGIGIATEHLEKIFERFYRVYDTADKTFPGLGIGLYISAEIIKRHNGEVWVESNAGRGSTFNFTLPISPT